ncbi:flagellar motor stator protein MotA [Rossellomorea aquimaris]|nr:flagellar motor stator protein MotA [Rossellomorea aquimaris]
MDKNSVIGMILAFVALITGMVLKGVTITALINPAAFLIIFAGTGAAILIATSTKTFMKIPALMKVLFKEQIDKEIPDYIADFTEWADIARKEGLLALEDKANELDDQFLKNGLMMAIDGKTPEFIRDVMLEEMDAIEERHGNQAEIFTKIGTFAPTLGVLGAAVGLMAALGHMEDTAALGHSISAAFVATIYGIFLGYVISHPIASKLKEKTKEEMSIKRVVIEGVLSLCDGQSPADVKRKLMVYIPESARLSLEEERDSNG